MKKDQQSSVGRFFGSRLFLVIALILMTVFALGFARAFYQDTKERKQIRQLEQEVSDLESKKIESFDILEYVKSSQYVEDKARTELNMKSPGESVVYLEDLTQDFDDLGNPLEDVSTDRQFISNPVKWWYYFIHKID